MEDSFCPLDGIPIRKKETILEESERLVSGVRGTVYHHPYTDFNCTVGILNSILGDRLSKPLDKKDVALIMIAVKLSRLSRSPGHRDSLVDLCGYARCYEMIQEREANETLPNK